ncbi:MAG: squalene--hopene cyclase [Pirellulales bacterium]|nr:squalene--hopene cyclase [Pirellulales bacterium]
MNLPPALLARVQDAYDQARRDLMGARDPSGHWTGRLASSALATATAVSALAVVDRHSPDGPTHRALIDQAIGWLASCTNEDGGWGDTDRSRSNVATTLLVLAAFRLALGGTGVSPVQSARHSTKHWQDASGTPQLAEHWRDASGTQMSTPSSGQYYELLRRAEAYVESQGGLEGLRRRYGKDRTFAVPILTNAALAGLVEWKEVAPLPFEAACLPHGLLRFLRLPVVSYALPALVAIGQAVYVHRTPGNPITRLIRRLAVGPSLKKLGQMQPDSGGFLEATPLTSFVVMSLAGSGRVDHPVVRRGVRFLLDSVREDGSWPIDTNLATWNTTLAINALMGDRVALASRQCSADCTGETPVPPRDSVGDDFDPNNELVGWLLDCQHRQVHPFTNAAPGGWGWTDLSGAVPDVDDTSGALLALARLCNSSKGATAGLPSSVFNASSNRTAGQASSGTPTNGTLAIDSAVRLGVGWLLDVQNADGGWPTFCRGWGTLPFDRSGTDLTAHAIRALDAWRSVASKRIDRAVARGFSFLARQQRADGAWTPLWFGNENDPAEENPVLGAARVLAAYRQLDRLSTEPARRGLEWLVAHHNADGGWGGDGHEVSGVEETALATEALLGAGTEPSLQVAVESGLTWLVDAVAAGRHRQAAPIGLYFARLWYHEMLYPMIFTVSALRRAIAAS